MTSGKPPRFLVTGAAGFIGSRLTRRLVADGAATAVVVLPDSSLARLADAADQVAVLYHDGSTGQLIDFVIDFAPDGVFHLGANFIGVHKSDDVVPLVADNVAFTAQICEAMAVAQTTCLVAAGTVWQHAKTPPGERMPTPNSLYAATKQAAEDIIAYYAHAGAFSSMVLKIYDSYGPDDPRPKFLNVLADAAAAGTTLDATAGKQQLHMVHVDDIVSAFRHAAAQLLSGDYEGHNSYALPSEKPVTLRELVAVWQAATGRTVDIAWGARADRPGEILVPWQGPPLPGWQAEVPLDAGFKAIWGS